MAVKFEAIIPKNLAGFFDFKKLERELIRALDDTIREVEKDYKRTVKTWKKKPTFTKINPRKLFGALDAKVTTKNEIYFFVEEGTRPHVIRPRQGGRLRFQAGYRAKTKPRVIGSTPGGSFGPLVSSGGVLHPGTAPRHFSNEIAKRRKKMLKSKVQGAFFNSFKFSFKFGGSR